MSDSATPWTAAYQAPPSTGFPRQEYWSGVPSPSPNTLLGILKDVIWLLFQRNVKISSEISTYERIRDKCELSLHTHLVLVHQLSHLFSRGSVVKNLPAIQETLVQSLGQEDPLEKGMATHSSILAWRIPWTQETARLVHGVTKSQIQLSNFHFTFITENSLYQEMLRKKVLFSGCFFFFTFNYDKLIHIKVI